MAAKAAGSSGCLQCLRCSGLQMCKSAWLGAGPGPQAGRTSSRHWCTAPMPRSTADSCSRHAASVMAGTSGMRLNTVAAEDTAPTCV
jgi:hypothetical protein